MQKISLLVLSLVLICILASCFQFLLIDNTVIIRGTVTITRNGEPWNTDNFPLYSIRNSNSREAGPPVDRPMLTAYSKEYGYIGEASVRYDTSSADYNSGTYQWALKISVDKLPCSIYFYVSCWMMDVYDSKGTDTGYFWISDRNTVTDLGIINYDVVKLSGNLPITVNGEACEALDEYSVSRMNIFIRSNSYPSYQTHIDPNGDWSLNIFQPDLEIPAVFQVETDLLGGIFKKVLNPEDAIIIYDTDIEVIFPDFESVNFEALALSGTIQLPVTDGRRLHIYLYYKNNTGSNSDTVLSGQEITWPEPDNNGLFEWKTMIPVYPLPFEIIARTELIKDVGMYRVDRYKSNKSIVITDTTDLNSIDLGDLKL
ncbi:MAG: hypothetical protein LBQ89_01360 [Treponema sp.]|nr:hypothetical protein [Treponema sp.]